MNTMTTAADVRASVDLAALIGRDTPLHKEAATRGGELAGPCPWCGGKDRLRVQPERGLWWCRQCSPPERWEDAISYVMRRDNLPFAEALRILGGESQPAPFTRPAAPPPPAESDEPTAEWRQAAERVVETCAATLWTEAGAKARVWLNRRGLRDGSILGWDIGFNAADQEIAGLWVPRGITIPWWASGKLWHINVRRAAGEPKYKAAAGGRPYLYGADGLADVRAAFLCEGELDTVLLKQEAGDLAGVASLGSCSKGMSRRAVDALLPVGRILLAYDSDAAGEKGAAKLAALSARMRRVEVPGGYKDLTDAHLAGEDLRVWAAFNLTLHGAE